MFEGPWNAPSPNVPLYRDELHVWQASLDVPVERLRRLRRLLSQDELSRAERFHFLRDCDHFIVGRGLLRTILAGYLHVPPRELAFRYNPYGKPDLESEFSHSDLRFNMSHSGGQVIYGVTRGRELGIDIEHIRPMEDAEGIIERFCAEQEKADFRALPTSSKLEAFFTCWTRKEACIKAWGDGLTAPLDEFAVSIVPGQPAELLSCLRLPEQAARWSLKELEVDAGYVAAVAVEGHGWSVVNREWSCNV